jgi:hypothetical protein
MRIPNIMHRKVLLACCTLISLLLVPTPAVADQGDDSNATAPSYDRPGFGFGTSALPLGGFAIEQGLPTWALENQNGVRTSQFVTDSLLRAGLGNGLEFQVGSTPFNWLSQREAGVSQLSTGRGDTVVSLKVAPPPTSQIWSWGVLATVEFPDGEGNLALPEREYTLGATVAQQLSSGNSLGYFAQWQRIGNHGTYQVAGNFGHPLSKAWGIYAEAVGLHQQARSSGLLGAGFTYLPSARLQWDISFDRRFIGSGAEWMADFGVAFYFGR